MLQALLDGGARRQAIEIFAGAGVLRGAPLLDGGIIPVFQPSVVIDDFNAMIFVDDWVLRGVGRLADGWALSKCRQGQQTGTKIGVETTWDLHWASLRETRELYVQGELNGSASRELPSADAV